MNPVPEYQILDVQNYPYAGAIRRQLRVRVPGLLEEDLLRAICEDIIEQQTTPYNALGFFFYPPEAEPGGMYIAGKAEWAPYGEWAKADIVRTGDYSRHKLVVTRGNASGLKPKGPHTGRPEEVHQQVFLTILKAEDAGGDSLEIRRHLAIRFGLTEHEVAEIVLEGIAKGWTPP